MTDAADLERRYRRWLRWYPKTFRREYEAEMLGVLLAGAREGQRQPKLMECLDLLRGAVWLRLCPRVPRSDRSVFKAVKLMYLGAVVELAAALVIVATIGDIRANVVKRYPGLTAGQWHAVVAGQLEPLAVTAALAVGFWLWMAWAIGHGQRWPRIAFAIFFWPQHMEPAQWAGRGGGGVRPASPDHRDSPLAGRTCGCRPHLPPEDGCLAGGRQPHHPRGLAAGGRSDGVCRYERRSRALGRSSVEALRRTHGLRRRLLCGGTR